MQLVSNQQSTSYSERGQFSRLQDASVPSVEPRSLPLSPSSTSSTSSLHFSSAHYQSGFSSPSPSPSPSPSLSPFPSPSPSPVSSTPSSSPLFACSLSSTSPYVTPTQFAVRLSTPPTSSSFSSCLSSNELSASTHPLTMSSHYPPRNTQAVPVSFSLSFASSFAPSSTPSFSSSLISASIQVQSQSQSQSQSHISSTDTTSLSSFQLHPFSEALNAVSPQQLPKTPEHSQLFN
ncbi:uncharacterized protein MONOS_14522 [Monocercomonoides exilis]|uniref:uncharacterized protein n=1 Tax=Monocercomonoides exilis TaxID=2049356 RepID=UPI003559B69D|nr:hypothetical protein MONOS_14522 [Monocercomonoides exilis]|eukprot:MONOS_14522.1-p1 / transcript=MONOS_14522.1 / gene=MONOS_14522 / organism=Monocercomonoides_exilis_PA203 / gene_product=unspecified product / transcript_product=unspecified product / location=Mono_scaffold01017:17422-18123(-) / protein_length=234 / sequence_SO=supercontig / SO=protein_coding / is_pseudo=false